MQKFLLGFIMFSKLGLPVLDRQDPWKEDLFKRKNISEVLSKLLKSTTDSIVIGLNAPYGFGKTFFLTRLREQIKNEDGWVIYVNAWEYDYLDSPFFAILDALKIAAIESPVLDSKKIAKTLKEIGEAAAPAILKGFGKKIAEKAIGIEGTEKVIDAVGDATEKTVERFIDRSMKSNTAHESLKILREKISEFITQNIKEGSTYPSLIVIIDELDRAKPNFSIRFLESVKHIFQAARVVFIIGCDKDVLDSCARHEFGETLDVDGYFRRLFDFWIELPEPKYKDYILSCLQRVGLEKDKILNPSGNVAYSSEAYANFLLLGTQSKKISLRFIEQSVTHASIDLRQYPNDRHAGLLGWLQGLKIGDPKLYDLYVSNGTNLLHIYNELKKHSGFSSSSTNIQAWIIVWFLNYKIDDDSLVGALNETSDLLKNVQRILGSHTITVDDSESHAFYVDKRLRSLSYIGR